MKYKYDLSHHLWIKCHVPYIWMASVCRKTEGPAYIQLYKASICRKHKNPYIYKASVCRKHKMNRIYTLASVCKKTQEIRSSLRIFYHSLFWLLILLGIWEKSSSSNKKDFRFSAHSCLFRQGLSTPPFFPVS